MKVRKGFVTNSSSTNFGVMLVTSLGGISAASLISAFEYDENAKKKEYVKLIVEAPVRRVLRPGQNVTISAQILKTEIIEGEISDSVSSVGGASIQCLDGGEIIKIEPTKGDGFSSSLTFTIIDDLDKLIKYSKPVIFSIEGQYGGETMKTNLSFTVPQFVVVPSNGVFVAEKETKEQLKLQSNFKTDYIYDFTDGNMLSESSIDCKDLYENIELIEDIDDIESNFDVFTCRVYRDYKIEAPIEGYKMNANYRAAFLRECILLNKKMKRPVTIKCYKDEESDKRTDEAYILAVKVVKYDDKTKSLKTDIDLTNNLTFCFEPLQNNKHLTFEKAKKALEDAKLVAELVPKDGEATQNRPYALYRIYSDALAETESDNVDMTITISCSDSDIKDIVVDGKLKPRINLKGLITQFIEYPIGTYIGSLIKLGNISTYHNAIDQLSEIKLVGSGNPKFDPRTNSMILRDIPKSIAEFKEVQTIHHELCHKIEEINGDSFLCSDVSFGERHSYYIQFLSDAAKKFSDVERGSVVDIDNTIAAAIISLYDAYYNEDNKKYPPNQGEINQWFGVRSFTPHEIIDRYLDFSIYCRNDSLLESIKEGIAQAAARQYFPGDIHGYWKEVGGLFDGCEWVMMWKYGNVIKVFPKHAGYTFKEMKRKWLGGNKLAFEVRYEVVRLSDNDEDELIAIFDGGTFDPKNWVYPKVNKFSLKWKAGRTLSECILGIHIDKTVDVIRK